MSRRSSLPRSIPLLALGASLLLALAACLEGRFPVCKDNSECAQRDGGTTGAVCYNLRCVECQYDTDCPAGKSCGVGNSCRSIDPNRTPEPDPAEEAKTRDECAKRCKDDIKACSDACDARFKK